MRAHPRLFDIELDTLKDCVDRALYDVKKFYKPIEYEKEVDYSRKYFNDFCDRNALRKYKPFVMEYFDRRVIEILAEERVDD